MKFMGSIAKAFTLSLCIIANTHLAYAQTASILPPAKTTFLDSNGNPLTAGKVDFYIPGTSTRKTTWQDAAETIPNTNPVTLDAAGRALILGSGSYRQVVKDKLGNLIWDQVTASGGSGGGGSSTVGDGNNVGTILPWSGFVAPSSYVFTYGQELTRIGFPALLGVLTQSQSATCTAGSPVLTAISDTSQLNFGASVEAACLPSGSTIVSKGPSAVQVSHNAVVSATASATFFPYGNGNGVTTFNVPDYRGTNLPGRNNMGGSASSRMTAQYYSGNAAIDPSALYVRGGTQSQTLALLNLPPYTPIGGISNGAITSTFTGNGGTTLNFAGSGAGNFSSGSFANLAVGGTVASTQAASTFAGTAQGGTSTPFSIISPSTTVNYIIKTTPNFNATNVTVVTSLGGQTGDIVCGANILCDGNSISANVTIPTATNSTFGIVKCDGVTVTCPAGTVTALGVSVATSIDAAGATSVTNGVPNDVLYVTGTGKVGNLDIGTSVTMYGAKGDGVNVVATVSIASGASALTATGAAFTAADVAKNIVIPGAGPGGAEMICTIVTFTDATHVGVNITASTTLSAVSKTLFYGTDNTVPFNNALAAGTAVFVPPGNFGHNGTIVLSKGGAFLIGAGKGATILTSTSKTQPAIKSVGAITNFGVKHLSTTRAPVALAGAYGFYQSEIADAGLIEGVTASKHYAGFSLVGTGYSRLLNSNAEFNVSHGVQMIPDALFGGAIFQWNLEDIISQQNGGDGFSVTTAGGASAGSMGNWTHISTFGNAGPAMHFTASPGKAINAVRVTGAFIGGDGGAAEIVLDTYSGPSLVHSFTDVQAEQASAAFFISTNNGPVSITNPWIQLMSGAGISMSGSKLTVNGGYIVQSTGAGISVPAGQLSVSNSTISQGASYGIAFAAGTGPHLVLGNDFTFGGANPSGAIFGAASVAAGSKIIDNIGYNPVGAHSIAVGPSPFTYTAGPSGENVFFSGGTIIAINVNGTGVYGAANNTSVPLEPGQSTTVAYTVAPTMTGVIR